MALPPPAPPSRYVWGRSSVPPLFSLLPIVIPTGAEGSALPDVGARYIVPFFASIFWFRISDFNFLSACHSIAQPARMWLPAASSRDRSNECLYLNQTLMMDH